MTILSISSTSATPLLEADFGIGRILGLFRLDYTYRFAHPRNAFVSLGVAQLL